MKILFFLLLTHTGAVSSTLFKKINNNDSDFESLFISISVSYFFEQWKIYVIDASDTMIRNPHFLILVDAKNSKCYRVEEYFEELIFIEYDKKEGVINYTVKISSPKKDKNGKNMFHDTTHEAIYENSEVKKQISLKNIKDN